MTLDRFLASESLWFLIYKRKVGGVKQGNMHEHIAEIQCLMPSVRANILLLKYDPCGVRWQFSLPDTILFQAIVRTQLH